MTAMFSHELAVTGTADVTFSATMRCHVLLDCHVSSWRCFWQRCGVTCWWAATYRTWRRSHRRLPVVYPVLSLTTMLQALAGGCCMLACMSAPALVTTSLARWNARSRQGLAVCSLVFSDEGVQVPLCSLCIMPNRLPAEIRRLPSFALSGLSM